VKFIHLSSNYKTTSQFKIEEMSES